jgi:dihydrofolate reductase
MRRLVAFTQVTLDGHFAGPNGDIGWAHREDEDGEWNTFVADNAKGGGQLLFGRVTYEMMAAFWPTPSAIESDPIVAERMNSLPKIVFSRTLERASWNNTTLVKGDLATAVRKLKQEPGQQMVLLGSGSIVSQLAQEGLIDEYQLVVNPVVLGQGKALFSGLKERLSLRPTMARTFRNGNVLLGYQPVA